MSEDEKADRIRRVYSYLRYGFILGGMQSLPGRVLRLGQRFDFIAAIGADLAPTELDRFAELVQLEARASVLLTEVLFQNRRLRFCRRHFVVSQSRSKRRIRGLFHWTVGSLLNLQTVPS